MQPADPRGASRAGKPCAGGEIGASADRGARLILGAILAGGRSSRFGSDKAAALLDSRALVEHVADGLRPWVNHVAIVGRDWPDLERIADVPRAGLGPMGGIAGALRWADGNGFRVVVTAGCDTPYPPSALLRRLIEGAPAFCATMPVIGAWPTTLAQAAETHAAHDPRRSVRGFAALVSAVALDWGSLPNINTPEDLARLETTL